MLIRANLALLFIFSSSLVLADGVYGPDNRTEIINSTYQQQRTAKSVAAMVDKEKLATFTAHNFVMPELELGSEEQLCSSEKFVNQPSLAECTGFLIAPNKILTAGHCIELETAPCKNFVWVFDYKVEKDGHYLADSEVVECKRIVRAHYDPVDKIDYAIIELKRKVARPSLEVFKEKLKVGDKLYTVGHPNGLPQKAATDGQVLELDKSFFGFKINEIVHNLDLFRGNSGSPIIHEESGKVVGIAVTGEADYKRSGQNCFEVERYEQSPELAEVAMSIGKVKEL